MKPVLTNTLSLLCDVSRVYETCIYAYYTIILNIDLGLPW